MISRFLFLLTALFVAVQFVPVERENPPVAGELSAPPEIQAVFERSCYDCHSNETRWPWYSRVAPASFLIAHDVEEGREHLNFSEWAGYPADDQRHLLEEIAEEVKEGEMPRWFYLPLHPSARLSSDEVGAVVQWASRGLPDQAPGEATEPADRTPAAQSATSPSGAPSGSPPSP